METKVLETLKLQAEHAMKSLEKNHINSYFVANSSDVVSKIAEILPEGSSVGVGGSQTLLACGVIDHLRSGRYTFHDRYAEGLTRAEILDIHRKVFTSDALICSCNAITLNGEIYNVDGNGNRVAAMIFGPKKVILVVGVNKIVRDLEAAKERVKMIAAPTNARRMGLKTPCAELGQCANCHSPERICCASSVINFQRDPDRIHVIFVGEELGY